MCIGIYAILFDYYIVLYVYTLTWRNSGQEKDFEKGAGKYMDFVL